MPTSPCRRSASGLECSGSTTSSTMRGGYLPLPGWSDLAFPLTANHAASHLRGTRRSLPHLRAPAQCTTANRGRRIGRIALRLTGIGCAATTPRGVRQGDAEAPGLGRTALCGGQGAGTACGVSGCGDWKRSMARPVGRGWTEPEALAGLAGLGASPVPQRSRRDRAPGTRPTTGPGVMATPRGVLRSGCSRSHAQPPPFSTGWVVFDTGSGTGMTG